MIKKICTVCKKQYEPRRPYLLKTSKFCGYKCMGQAKRTSIVKKCKVCQKNFDCDLCRKERHEYCSTKCQYKSNSKSFKDDGNPNWKGGIYYIGKYLYVKSPHHPNKNSAGYVAQHRLVMEDSLGRYLTSNEEVHHKNQIKDDNRIENLEVVVKSAHFGEINCPHCQKDFKIK